MLMSGCRSAALAVLACVCVLAGCDDAPPEKTEVAPGAGKPAAVPKVANLSTQMVAAVSSGKTASVISVHFVLGAAPTVGKPLPVEIAIVPHRKFLAVRAHFETHDGLTMTSGDVYGPKEDAESESVLKHNLMLSPEKEGVFMVSAVVDTEGEDGNVTRIFSIPVIVGPAQTVAAVPPPAPAAVPVAEKPTSN